MTRTDRGRGIRRAREREGEMEESRGEEEEWKKGKGGKCVPSLPSNGSGHLRAERVLCPVSSATAPTGASTGAHTGASTGAHTGALTLTPEAAGERERKAGKDARSDSLHQLLSISRQTRDGFSLSSFFFFFLLLLLRLSFISLLLFSLLFTYDCSEEWKHQSKRTTSFFPSLFYLAPSLSPSLAAPKEK